MKKTQKIFVVTLLIMVLVFSSGQLGCEEEQETSFSTSGLTMNFVENAPPIELVTGLSYPIYVDVQNFGGSGVSEGTAHFYLSGVGENLDNVETRLINTILLSKKTDVQEGGKERIIFATSATPSRVLPAEFNFNLQLDVCYRYSTVVQVPVCIGEGSSVCSIAGEKVESESNTDAPIQVTSLTEQISGNQLTITFLIENKGIGEVYLPDSNCDKLQENDIDEISKKDRVEVSIIAEEGVACNLQLVTPVQSLSGTTSLGTVTCQKTLTDGDTHITPFQINILYNYRQSINKELTILPA